jgi:hypothetical protein
MLENMREIHGRDAGWSAVGNGDLECILRISCLSRSAIPAADYCSAFLRRALNASVDIGAWQV